MYIKFQTMTNLNNRLWFKWSERKCVHSDIINNENLKKLFQEDTPSILHSLAFAVQHTALHLIWKRVLNFY